jgi:hypothetical protein
MNTIYCVQQYTFEDWNIVKWFNTIEEANELHSQLCNKHTEHKCYFKVKEIFNDAMGNNFRFFNISNNNQG